MRRGFESRFRHLCCRFQVEEVACKATYVDASSTYSSHGSATIGVASCLENSGVNSLGGSNPSASALEDTRPVRSHAANVVGRQPTGFDSQVFR